MQTLPHTLYRLELGLQPEASTDLGWLPLAVEATWHHAASLVSATAVDGAPAAVAVIHWRGASGAVNVNDRLTAALPGMPLGSSAPMATITRVDAAGPAELPAGGLQLSTGETYLAAAALLVFVGIIIHRTRRGRP